MDTREGVCEVTHTCFFSILTIAGYPSMSNGGESSHFDPKLNIADLIRQFQRMLNQYLEAVHERINQLASEQSRSKSIGGKRRVGPE